MQNLIEKLPDTSTSFLPSSFIPDLIIYHNVVENFPCPDGLASAWVCHKKYASFSYSPTFQGCCYDQEPPNIDSYQNILVVDFSFSEAILERWQAAGKIVYVIDHHKGFKQALEAGNAKKSYSLSDTIFNSDKILVDLDESGATLTWRVLFPGEKMPIFLEYVRDRDLFIKKLPSSDLIHAAYGKLQRSFNLYDNLAELDQEMLIDFMKPIGQISLDRKYAAIAKYMKKVEFWQDIPVVTLCKSAIALKSDLGEFLCNFYPFARFCVILVKNQDVVRVRSSLYTWNTDLIALFSDFVVVGGHTGAASFTYTESLESLKALVLERYSSL